MGLGDGVVQCVVTSPPYWGLRKYDGEQDSVWGGDAECEHEWGSESEKNLSWRRPAYSLPGVVLKRAERHESYSQGSFCLKCGAWRGAFGLEPTPEMYVEHTVLFLREIWRVLKDDGCVFLNLGDSYWGGKGSNGSSKARRTAAERGYTQSEGTLMCDTRPSDGRHETLKPKDLCLIPFRVALAAQADGWWVRSDIVWAKPNPMPESVKDRPTSSYEHIFMLTKSKDYYWNADAVREPLADCNGQRSTDHYSTGRYGPMNGGNSGLDALAARMRNGEHKGRNLRDVWTIATYPSGFEHYAAFPPKIPETCIKAATKLGDTVLDPFCGTGRTLYAAQKLGREAIGFDASERYCEMARQRCGLL